MGYMLSVIVITKNEALNIRRCLASVTNWVDEIIVLDSGSTDETVAIAKEYTDYVYTTSPEDWRGYGVQKQRALSYAKGHWVLNLDADESVSQSLKTTLLKVMHEDKADAYRIPICMYFYGQRLAHSSSPSRHIRLFKRAGAKYSDDIVHEKILLSPQARIGKIYDPILHHSFRDISHALYKMNHYSSSSAKIRIAENYKISWLKTMLGTTWMFFRCYVLQRGFLDGRAGLLFAILNAQGTFYRGIKQLYQDYPLK